MSHGSNVLGYHENGRPYPAGQDQQVEQGRSHRPGEDGELQPAFVRQGQGWRRHDRRRREKRAPQAGCYPDRADQRQHRRRTGLRGGGEGLQTDHRHAGDHVHRATQARAGSRRQLGAYRGDEGHAGRHRQGERIKGSHPRCRDSWSVRQPRQPRDPLPDDRS